MSSFSNTVTIDRSLHDVFAFVADFENVPSWNYAIDETRKTTPGPVAVGTTYEQHRSVPAPSDERFTITELVPDRAVAIQGTLGPFPARLRYEVEPAGTGTVLTNDVELDVSGPLRLVGPVVASKVKAAVAEKSSSRGSRLRPEDRALVVKPFEGYQSSGSSSRRSARAPAS